MFINRFLWVKEPLQGQSLIFWLNIIFPNEWFAYITVPGDLVVLKTGYYVFFKITIQSIYLRMTWHNASPLSNSLLINRIHNNILLVSLAYNLGFVIYQEISSLNHLGRVSFIILGASCSSKPTAFLITFIVLVNCFNSFLCHSKCLGDWCFSQLSVVHYTFFLFEPLSLKRTLKNEHLFRLI